MTTFAANDGRFWFANVAFGAYTASVTFGGQTAEYPVDVAGARAEIKLIR